MAHYKKWLHKVVQIVLPLNWIGSNYNREMHDFNNTALCSLFSLIPHLLGSFPATISCPVANESHHLAMKIYRWAVIEAIQPFLNCPWRSPSGVWRPSANCHLICNNELPLIIIHCFWNFGNRNLETWTIKMRMDLGNLKSNWDGSVLIEFLNQLLLFPF